MPQQWNNRRCSLLVILVLTAFTLAGISGTIGTVQAHGASIAYTIAPTVHITATYDSGEPMIQAQVTVYAPDDPATPWLLGETDDAGGFSFVPDPELPGVWAVQVRQAGHGDILHIQIGAAGASLTGSTGGFTPLQIVVMAAAVIWGFVGTALYFSNRQARQSRNIAANPKEN